MNETHLFDATKLNEFRGGMARVVGLSDIPPHLEIPLININASSGFSTSSFPSGYYQANPGSQACWDRVRTTASKNPR